MKLSLLSSASALMLSSSVSAAYVPQNPVADIKAAVYEAVKRATPANAPYGYTPQQVACPASQPTVRMADGLSEAETTWLESRRPQAIASTEQFLTRLNITGFDAATYFSTHASNTSALPNIAIAASGGGYRALMNGAGALAAFDNRTTNGTATGHLGGLLQSATYLAGLSGGSWLVGSLYANNYTSVETIINTNSQLWDFTNSIIKGPEANGGFISSLVNGVEYYTDLFDEVKGKENAGFNTTLTDIWGRALSYQLINATNGGPAYTFSSIVNQTFFTNGSVPLPVFVSDSREPGQVIIPSNTTIYEFNPFEMGSWDPTVYGFTDMQFVGTNFSDGQVMTGEDCVVGFDNIGFVYGTSSTLFNQIVLQFNTTVTDIPDFLSNAIQDLLNDFGAANEDIADWVNPFYNWRPEYNAQAVSQRLTLVDGGENNENLPLNPLVQPVRNVDVIFAIDSSADTNTNWPNGSSLVSTYQRSLNVTLQNNTGFPAIPDTSTFVNLGLNTRPTFFGCDASNFTNTGSTTDPLIVYLPNAPYSYHSNVSTYDLSYTDDERNSIIQNGYNAATRGNSSEDMWPTCVGCALLRRSLERTGTAFPTVCNTCFTDYCWNGTTNSTFPALYEPELLIANASATTSAAGKGVAPGVGALVTAVGVAFAWALL